MSFEDHILPPANPISALTEQLNPCLVVLHYLKNWVTGKETSIHGRNEKHVLLYPQKGRQNDRPKHRPPPPHGAAYEDKDHRPQYIVSSDHANSIAGCTASIGRMVNRKTSGKKRSTP